MIAPVDQWAEECRVYDGSDFDYASFAKLVAEYCANTAAMCKTGAEAESYICMDFDLDNPNVE